MTRRGQVFLLKGNLNRITVEEVTSEYVKISCLNGGIYEVYPNGSIVTCSYMGVKGQKNELRPFLTPEGYLMVRLRFCHRQVNVSVHRLVAMCFIPNPYNLPQVNHKDENKINNHVDNLEWCDNKYNVNYSLDLNDPTRPGRLEKMDVEKRAKAIKTAKSKNISVKLTKDKVKSMLRGDIITISCDSACELSSVYQTAFTARKELGEKGRDISLSRSNITMTVVIKKGN